MLGVHTPCTNSRTCLAKAQHLFELEEAFLFVRHDDSEAQLYIMLCITMDTAHAERYVLSPALHT